MELSKGKLSLNLPNTCHEFVLRVTNHHITLRDGCRTKGDLYVSVPVHVFIATIHETYLMMRGLVDLDGNPTASPKVPPASAAIFEPSLITPGGKLRPLSSVIRADLSWLSATVEAVDRRLEECEGTSAELDAAWLQSLFSTACASPTPDKSAHFTPGISRPSIAKPLQGTLPRVVAVPAVKGDLPPILRAHFSHPHVIARDSTQHGLPALASHDSTCLPNAFPLASPSRFSIMLVRTPYDKSAGKNVKLCLFYACSGFAAYIQDVRGRFQSSSGPGPSSRYSFYKYVHESNDGMDTVATLAKLCCCNGRVVGNGKSYLAHTQLGVFIGERGYRRGGNDEAVPESRAFEYSGSEGEEEEEEEVEVEEEHEEEEDAETNYNYTHNSLKPRPRNSGMSAADRKLISRYCRSSHYLAKAAQDAASTRDAHLVGWRGGFLNMGGFFNAFTSGVRQGGAFEARQLVWAFKKATNPLIRDVPRSLDLPAWLRALPLKLDQFLHQAPAYQAFIRAQMERTIFAPFWLQKGFNTEAYMRCFDVHSPALLFSGWYDIYARSTIELHAAIDKEARRRAALLRAARARGLVCSSLPVYRPVLVMGPWGHTSGTDNSSVGEVYFGRNSKISSVWQCDELMDPRRALGNVPLVRALPPAKGYRLWVARDAHRVVCAGRPCEHAAGEMEEEVASGSAGLPSLSDVLSVLTEAQEIRTRTQDRRSDASTCECAVADAMEVTDAPPSQLDVLCDALTDADGDTCQWCLPEDAPAPLRRLLGVYRALRQHLDGEDAAAEAVDVGDDAPAPTDTVTASRGAGAGGASLPTLLRTREVVLPYLLLAFPSFSPQLVPVTTHHHAFALLWLSLCAPRRTIHLSPRLQREAQALRRAQALSSPLHAPSLASSALPLSTLATLACRALNVDARAALPILRRANLLQPHCLREAAHRPEDSEDEDDDVSGPGLGYVQMHEGPDAGKAASEDSQASSATPSASTSALATHAAATTSTSTSTSTPAGDATAASTDPAPRGGADMVDAELDVACLPLVAYFRTGGCFDYYSRILRGTAHQMRQYQRYQRRLPVRRVGGPLAAAVAGGLSDSDSERVSDDGEGEGEDSGPEATGADVDSEGDREDEIEAWRKAKQRHLNAHIAGSVAAAHAQLAAAAAASTAAAAVTAAGVGAAAAAVPAGALPHTHTHLHAHTHPPPHAHALAASSPSTSASLLRPHNASGANHQPAHTSILTDTTKTTSTSTSTSVLAAARLTQASSTASHPRRPLPLSISLTAATAPPPHTSSSSSSSSGSPTSAAAAAAQALAMPVARTVVAALSSVLAPPVHDAHALRAPLHEATPIPVLAPGGPAAVAEAIAEAVADNIHSTTDSATAHRSASMGTAVPTSAFPASASTPTSSSASSSTLLDIGQCRYVPLRHAFARTDGPYVSPSPFSSAPSPPAASTSTHSRVFTLDCERYAPRKHVPHEVLHRLYAQFHKAHNGRVAIDVERVVAELDAERAKRRARRLDWTSIVTRHLVVKPHRSHAPSAPTSVSASTPNPSPASQAAYVPSPPPPPTSPAPVGSSTSTASLALPPTHTQTQAQTRSHSHALRPVPVSANLSRSTSARLSRPCALAPAPTAAAPHPSHLPGLAPSILAQKSPPASLPLLPALLSTASPAADQPDVGYLVHGGRWLYGTTFPPRGTAYSRCALGRGQLLLPEGLVHSHTGPLCCEAALTHARSHASTHTHGHAGSTATSTSTSSTFAPLRRCPAGSRPYEVRVREDAMHCPRCVPAHAHTLPPTAHPSPHDPYTPETPPELALRSPLLPADLSPTIMSWVRQFQPRPAPLPLLVALGHVPPAMLLTLGAHAQESYGMAGVSTAHHAHNSQQQLGWMVPPVPRPPHALANATGISAMPTITHTLLPHAQAFLAQHQHQRQYQQQYHFSLPPHQQLQPTATTEQASALTTATARNGGAVASANNALVACSGAADTTLVGVDGALLLRLLQDHLAKQASQTPTSTAYAPAPVTASAGHGHRASAVVRGASGTALSRAVPLLPAATSGIASAAGSTPADTGTTLQISERAEVDAAPAATAAPPLLPSTSDPRAWLPLASTYQSDPLAPVPAIGGNVFPHATLQTDAADLPGAPLAEVQVLLEGPFDQVERADHFLSRPAVSGRVLAYKSVSNDRRRELTVNERNTSVTSGAATRTAGSNGNSSGSGGSGAAVGGSNASVTNSTSSTASAGPASSHPSSSNPSVTLSNIPLPAAPPAAIPPAPVAVPYLPPPGLPLSARRDVLSFESAPLVNSVEVTGAPWVTLYVVTDRFDVDFTAQLQDVYPPSSDFPAGFALNITHGIIRARHRYGFSYRGVAPHVSRDLLAQTGAEPTAAAQHGYDPQQPNAEVLLQPLWVHMVSIEMFPCSNLFAAGHRIRLTVASSCFPHFCINPQTPEGQRGQRVAQATNTVLHSRLWPSSLWLPIAGCARCKEDIDLYVTVCGEECERGRARDAAAAKL